MCGRYSIISKIKAIEKRFNLIESTINMEMYQNVNVSAGELAPIITSSHPNQLTLAQFGFTPQWSKKRYYIINARSEGDNNPTNDRNFTGGKGIISKPMFRQSIRSKRCLVIADAFVEGPEKEKLSKPYLVYNVKKNRPFAFAGIYDEWVNPDTGEIVLGFTILTTASNDLTSSIGHHRAPLILPREQEQAWLDLDTPLNEITSMMHPFEDQNFNAYPISDKIKSKKNKSLELLKPVGQRIRPEYDYVLYQELELLGMGESTAKNRRASEEDDQLSLF